jgi:purine-binding chemotaxis protein CheW
MKKRNKDSMTALVFALGNDRYAMDTVHVVEIRAYETPHRVPLAPPGIKGVLKLQGQAAPVIDLRELFGYTDVSVAPSTMTIVLRRDGKLSAVVVDSVDDVVAIKTSDLQAVPASMRAAASRSCVQGLMTLNEHLVLVVDGAQLAGTNAQHSLVVPTGM